MVFSSSVKVELGYFYGIKLSCYEVVQYNYSERKGKFIANYICVAFWRDVF